MTAPKRAEVQAAAGLLRDVLAKVDAGELDAPGRRGRAVVARIESAALALDVAAGVRDP